MPAKKSTPKKKIISTNSPIRVLMLFLIFLIICLFSIKCIREIQELKETPTSNSTVETIVDKTTTKVVNKLK